MTKQNPPSKPSFHPQNRFRFRYDFEKLSVAYPPLKRYIIVGKHGHATIPFADPSAVKALNQALLMRHYGLNYWDIPTDYLCPPIPGRADYLHHLGDLLAKTTKGKIPKGKFIRILDIGVGANCIYPIIGVKEFDWSFVGSDIDATAIQAAQLILEKNSSLKSNIELRVQYNAAFIFKNIIQKEDQFTAVICNPPFYSSAKEANKHTQRKWKNLQQKKQATNRNFGGQSNELWYKGGEKAFIQKMIEESQAFATNCLWFTTLVSKKAHLAFIYRQLEKHNINDIQTIEMGQGQKTSRIVAWRF